MPDDDTTTETPDAEVTKDENTDAIEPEADADADEPIEGDTFNRPYVERIRRQADGLRSRAQDAEARAEELSQRLHTALVTATGRLQDPGDLAYAAEHLDDADALTVAIDTLLEAKPHLRARRITGDAGLGVKGAEDTGPTDLLGIMRSQL